MNQSTTCQKDLKLCQDFGKSRAVHMRFSGNRNPLLNLLLLRELVVINVGLGLGKMLKFTTFFEGGEVHISEIACEQIFLDLPYQPLCDESCKGLCPACGKDLNLSVCDCTPDELESGFSVLKKLKLN